MTGCFAGKVAIVTGTASGIGLATATRLAQDGGSVVLADLHGDAAEAAATRLPGQGASQAVGIACDVSSEGQVESCVKATLATPRCCGTIPNVKSGAEVVDRADVGRPEDIAAAIAYLLSEDAAFVTGAALRVDGGRPSKL